MFVAYDVCGIYEPPRRDLTAEPHFVQIKAFVDEVSVDHKNVVLPNSKAYTSTDSRLRSFERCGQTVNQDIFTLCESGLYYIGKLFSNYNFVIF